jgi:pimeloyl-ACP methyl ester carboxylesterase
MFVKTIGSGPPLVLLHGFCENHHIWQPVAAPLAKNFEVWMPDLPGFGASPPLREGFSLQQVAEAISNHLQSVSRPPVVIGRSLGGYVALALAKGGLPMSGLGLFHSTAHADTDEKKASRDKTIEFVKAHGPHPFLQTFVSGLFAGKNHFLIEKVAAICRGTSAEAIIGYSRAMRNRPDQTRLLQSIAVPIWIGAGQHDSILPYSLLQQQAFLPPKCRFSLFLNSGHMAMFEEPEATWNEVEDFATSCFGDQDF